MKTEDRIQQEIVIWYTNNYCLSHHNPQCLIAHIPNEGQQRLVGVGVLPGFSDLIVIHATQHAPPTTVYFEVKTPTGTQSPAQKKFQARITTLGFQYHIVRSLEEFANVVGIL